jgi:predicted metalloprotease with PDZ domain
MTDSLWLAEGFTQYYGVLLLARAGLLEPRQALAQFGAAVNAVIRDPGRQVNSPVDMSRMAPFVDAARSIDPTDFDNTFISYYTYGSAVALGLDLSLRDRSNGTLTLDDFMRGMWRKYGKPGGRAPGLVAHPYSLTDIRDTLADVSGDRAFADDFFRRYMTGRDVPDYARLLQRAGIVFRRRNPGRGWMGAAPTDGSTRIGDLVPPGSPAYEAGLEHDDQITAIDGREVSSWTQLLDVIASRKPGDRVRVDFRRRNGTSVNGMMTLQEDPSTEIAAIEDTGGAPSAEQKAFRDAWLGPHVR